MQAVLCPPSKSGHPQAVEPASHLPAHKAPAVFPQLPAPAGRQEQPSSSQKQPAAHSPRVPRLQVLELRRSRWFGAGRKEAAAPGAAERAPGAPAAPASGREEGQEEGGSREPSPKPGARAPRQSSAATAGLGGCLGGRASRICSIAESPCCALFEASLCLGKLIPRVRDSQLPLQVPPLTPPSITVQILPGALNAPSTAASLGLCSCLLSSSI